MEGNQVEEAQELIERAFIAACFIDEGAFDLYRASGIGPQAFQREANRLMAEEMEAMLAKGIGLDYMTLAKDTEKDIHLADIADVIGTVDTASHAESHWAQIVDSWRMRNFKEQALKLSQLAEESKWEDAQGFAADRAVEGATVYAGDASAYRGVDRPREAVRRSVGEYFRDQARASGLEGFWAPLKRARKGTFRKMSPKRLNRYVDEFSGRHDAPSKDTADQMGQMAAGMVGKRLRYGGLIAQAGLASGAKPAT